MIDILVGLGIVGASHFLAKKTVRRINKSRIANVRPPATGGRSNEVAVFLCYKCGTAYHENGICDSCEASEIKGAK